MHAPGEKSIVDRNICEWYALKVLIEDEVHIANDIKFLSFK